MSERHTRSQPLVSVITIFLDAAPFLRESIESVRSQTYSNWELLLIDDGSSDGSTEIAQHYAALDPKRIRYLEHPGHENRGMSASRNLGIANGSGEMIAFLDADDVFLSDKLDQQVEQLVGHPEVGMIYGTTEYWFSWTGRDEDRGRDRRSACDLKQGSVIQPPLLLRLFLQSKATVPCMGSILVRREVVERVGGFEDQFKGMFEDQVFYSKVGLETPVLISCQCHDRYRQHPGSCFSQAKQAGSVLTARRRYLEWLMSYLKSRQEGTGPVSRDVSRDLWLCDHPWLCLLYTSDSADDSKRGLIWVVGG